MRPRSLRFRLALAPLVLLAVGSLAGEAGAALFAYDGFNYPSNLGGSVNGLNGGTGWPGGWSDGDGDVVLAATNTSLAFPSGTTFAATGGRIELTATDTLADATRLMSTGLNFAANGQTYYSSALFQASAVLGETALVQFNDGTNVRWTYGINATGNFQVSVNPTAGQLATSAFALTPGETYFLVAKFRTNTGGGGNDEVFLRIFNSSSIVGAEPATDAGWDLAAAGGSSITANQVRLTFANGVGQTNQFDEFRVGNTWFDVVGVPEPGTYAMAACAALCGLAVAWRRRQRPQA